jgi:hypothetical protein
MAALVRIFRMVKGDKLIGQLLMGHRRAPGRNTANPNHRKRHPNLARVASSDYLVEIRQPRRLSIECQCVGAACPGI